MNSTTKIFSILLASTILSSCGIGQKKVLFTTRSNVGLDVDAKQFTAQINIDRQEAVIGPTFEGGQHVPIAAAFRNDNKLLGGFGVSSLFAGGDAALALTTPSDPNRKKGESLISLSQPPKFERSIIGKFFDWINPFMSKNETNQNKNLPGPGQVKPFIFDTDTSLGIKLAWTGATGEFPDKVKIGFNREEFALAPIMATRDASDLADLQKQKILVDVFSNLVNNSEKEIGAIKNNIRAIEEEQTGLEQKLQVTKINLKANSTDKNIQTNAQHLQASIDKNKAALEKLQTALNVTEIYTVKITEQLNEAKINSYQVGVPSFFAALDNYSEFKSMFTSNIGFRQVFAAGQSATNLANDLVIKNMVKQRFGLTDVTIPEPLR